jgi:PAS domain S-box-containing protein
MQDHNKTKDQQIAEMQNRIASLEELLADQQNQIKLFRESEERYYNLFRDSAVGMVVVMPDGRITQSNNAFCDFLGYSEPELFGKTVLSITHPDDREASSKAIIQSFTSGLRIQRLDKRYLHKSRRVLWGEVSTIMVCDAEGKPSYSIAQVLDITERKRTEEALQKAHDELEHRVAETMLNEARLEAVLQLSHMAGASLQEITDFALEQAVALTKSKIGYLAFMNEDETVLTMYSWSKEAMAECAISDKPLVYPLKTTGLWGEAARQRKPIVTNDYAAPNPLKKGLPDGHVGLRRHMNVPILDRGHIVIVAGVGNKEEDYDQSDVRQLTLLMEGMWTLIQRQRVQTELQRHRDHLEQLVRERTKALQQSHDELQTIYDGMVDGLLIADIETKRFIRANATICRMLGYSEDELLSRSVMDIHPANDLPTVLKAFQALTAEKITISENTPVLRKDGSGFYADIGTKAMVYNGCPSVIGFFHDITERILAQEALQREHRTLKHLLQSSDHERQTIAYEIHDGLAQYLAAAIMQFDVYKHLLEKKPNDAMKAYEGAMTLIRQSHAETRRLIAGVRPPVLDEAGVVEAVAHLINEQNRDKRPQIEFNSKVQFRRLVPILENAIYRICQEGLSNACKHSQSERVLVR